MKHSPVWNKFNRILSLWKKHRFCTVKHTDNEIFGIKYGALGSQLKQNIFNQWTSSTVSNSDVNIFPVESNELPPPKLVSECQHHEESLSEDILHHYVDTLPLIGENLPFGLALSKGKTSANYNKSVDAEAGCEKPGAATKEIPHGGHTISWNPVESTSLVVAFFCSPKKITDWFYYWHRLRYTWWRKLASDPSGFSISNITPTSNGDQYVTLQCDFPWGRGTLEKVTASPCLKDSSTVANQNASTSGDRSIVPSVITCEADLDLAVIAYLSNAYEERQWVNNLKPVLRLHHMLAPYKVSIVISGSSAENIKKLRNLATVQVKELKENGISVLPNPQLATEVSLDMQFTRFDEMGVPYTVVLSDSSLNGGIAGLRSRDNTVQEQIHVAELTHRLLLDIQMKSKIS